MTCKLLRVLVIVAAVACCGFVSPADDQGQAPATAATATSIDPSRDLGEWEGWGSSLAWWARAIGGTGNADHYADLIYTTKSIDGCPGLGLNIVRYNVGGGGIKQPQENKGPKLQWQMDIHGYWQDPNRPDPANWDWSADSNQRSMMQKARARGANVFALFSDSPMWWMNTNHSTAGSDTGGNCLAPENQDRFASYLATVARHAADHWEIHFTSVEAFNEPSADWWKYPIRQEGCHFDAAAQQAMIPRLRHELDRLGLNNIAVAAADENDIDVALNTWKAYDPATRALVGEVNAHGYYKGTESYRGPNGVALRKAVGSKRLWQSEYGDGDASGYTMANSIIRNIRELNPNAWVYWQPVEPDVPGFGWGLLNANYVDTHDSFMPGENTPLVRVNRKFFVYGQFTRYIRPGSHFIDIGDGDSIAAYDGASHKLVIVTVTRDLDKEARYDLSKFNAVGQSVQRIATTTAPGNGVPDWKEHADILRLDYQTQKVFAVTLYPRSVYTFVIENVLP